jgi:RimJ/RimL family protein N-acetyltransferase
VTRFRTARLEVRDTGEADIDALLGVRLSNPGYLELTEGSAGEPGRFDRGMLERDLAMALLIPGRHPAVIALADSGEVVGELDWMDENPSDGSPWLGLVMVHAAHQRRGMALEAVRGLAGHGREAGWSRLREGVLAENEAGLGLARAAGFAEVDRRPHRVAAGERELIVLELAL